MEGSLLSKKHIRPMHRSIRRIVICVQPQKQKIRSFQHTLQQRRLHWKFIKYFFTFSLDNKTHKGDNLNLTLSALSRLVQLRLDSSSLALACYSFFLDYTCLFLVVLRLIQVVLGCSNLFSFAHSRKLFLPKNFKRDYSRKLFSMISRFFC